MKHGKQICATLREVRKQIAEANGIDFNTTECTHQGDCKGTCPKCEAELHCLENQLSLRRATGKAVVVTGIALSAMNVYAQIPEPVVPQPSQNDSTAVVQQGNFEILGKVIDENNESMVGVSILEIGTKHAVQSDIDGHFILSVDSLPARIRFFYVGYEEKECTITEENFQNIVVQLDVDKGALIGEVVIIPKRKINMRKIRSFLHLRKK